MTLLGDTELIRDVVLHQFGYQTCCLQLLFSYPGTLTNSCIPSQDYTTTIPPHLDRDTTAIGTITATTTMGYDSTITFTLDTICPWYALLPPFSLDHD